MEKLMAPDQRDQNFDKALARHMRSVASSGEAANSPAEPGLQRGTCPDAETLAAYHERSLLTEEMNSWKTHIVGCAHCQMILAQLEATENIPLHAAEKEEVLAMKKPELAASVRGLGAVPMAAASQGRPAADAAQPRKARSVRLSSGPRWLWLAPAGAIAAGLLVWISLHENQQPRFPSLDETKIAKKQEPPAPTSPAATRVPAAAPPVQLSQPKPPSAADELTSSNGSIGEESLKQRERTQITPKLAPPMLSKEKENGVRKDAQRDSSVALNGRADKAELDAKTSSAAAQQNAEVQAQSAPVSNYQYNAKVPGPAPLSQAQAQVPARKKSEANAPVPAAPPAAGGVAGGVTAATTSNQIGAATEMVMVVSDPHLIYAPGSNSMWRTGPAGLIEFSPNGGSSWSRQTSGVLVELLTGSAPSDKVCWIVGRVGAILLTPDGGAHWELIPSPLKEDLGGVQATDALHATIWNVRSTKSFETSDGGLTWRRVANQ
jgi:hypothetical protein